jgi:hypothetical protein
VFTLLRAILPDSKHLRTDFGNSQRFLTFPLANVEIPSRGDGTSVLIVLANSFDVLRNSSGFTCFNFVEETNLRNGFISNPWACNPQSAPVKGTVPLPEKGSIITSLSKCHRFLLLPQQSLEKSLLLQNTTDDVGMHPKRGHLKNLC